MTSIKLKFRPSLNGGSEGYLFFQVIHDRVVRQIGTGLRISESEWDEMEARLVTAPDTDYARCRYLQQTGAELDAAIMRLGKVVDTLERQGCPYATSDVVTRYRATSIGIREYSQKVIGEMERLGRVRCKETYETAIRSLMRYRADRDIPLADMTQTVVAGYERYLREQELSVNTVSFYMRNLRAIYNRAVDEGLIEQSNPFRRVYTGVAKTVKRAIPLQELRRIKRMDLSAWPAVEFARDMFMFSFYTRGMAFIDMAFLRSSDLSGGMLSYKRRKTGQRLVIRWEREMAEIVSRYHVDGSPYLLPLIRIAGADERKQYRNASHHINTKLKWLGRMLGLSMPLTMYVARHAWASIARSKNVSVSVISEAMGHDSEMTTRIYLAAIDTNRVDRANSRIIRSV